MAYGSIEGVKDRIPKLAKYIKVSSTDPLDILESKVTELLDEISSQVDAALGQIYLVPFNPVPALITKITNDLAGYALSVRYQTQITAEENQNLLAIRRDANDLLTKLSNGEALLSVAAKVDQQEIDEVDQLINDLEAEDSVFDMGDESKWQSKL